MVSGALFRAVAIALALLCLGAGGARAAEIVVEVTGIPSTRGHIRVSLFRETGWLEDEARVTGAIAPASGPNVTLTLPDVPPGTYGIALIHDADDDGDMTYTFLGLPAEGFGFSNNVRPRLSAPDFAAAAFVLGPEGAHLKIALIHL